MERYKPFTNVQGEYEVQIEASISLRYFTSKLTVLMRMHTPTWYFIFRLFEILVIIAYDQHSTNQHEVMIPNVTHQIESIMHPLLQKRVTCARSRAATPEDGVGPRGAEPTLDVMQISE